MQNLKTVPFTVLSFEGQESSVKSEGAEVASRSSWIMPFGFFPLSVSFYFSLFSKLCNQYSHILITKGIRGVAKGFEQDN